MSSCIKNRLYNSQFVPSIGQYAGIAGGQESMIFYRQGFTLKTGGGGNNFANGIPLKIPQGFYFKLISCVLRFNSTLDYVLALSLTNAGNNDLVSSTGTSPNNITNFNGPIIWMGFNAVAISFNYFPFVLSGEKPDVGRTPTGIKNDQVCPGGWQINYGLFTNDSPDPINNIVVADTMGLLLRDLHNPANRGDI